MNFIVALFIACSSLFSLFNLAHSEEKKVDELENKTNSDSDIEVQWEANPIAFAYELEFQPLSSQGQSQSQSFTTSETSFKSKFPPGSYRFRIRSIDKEKEKGEWSAPIVVMAQPQEVHLHEPINGFIVSAKEKIERIEFSWDSYPEAKGYVFRLWSEKKENLKNLKTKKENLSLMLPAGEKYFWEVDAVHRTGVRYQRKSPPFVFSLYGKQLPIPEIEILRPKDPQGFIWKKINPAQYRFHLYRRELLASDWVKIESQESLTDTKWMLKEPLSPAQYKIEVVAYAHMRTESPVGTKEFLVKPKWKEMPVF